MAGTEQPQEFPPALSQSLLDLDKLYEQLKVLEIKHQNLHPFLTIAISYLHCLYQCYQKNNPKHLDDVKPFFEKALLAIQGGIFKDTGENAYITLREQGLAEYLPEIYNPSLVLDQMHMLLNSFTKGEEFQNTTGTLGWLFSSLSAEGSSWLPRASILRRIPDQLLPLVEKWHEQLGKKQASTYQSDMMYKLMLAYRCMPEIRASFMAKFSNYTIECKKRIDDLVQECQKLDASVKAEKARLNAEVEQQKARLNAEFSVAQKALTETVAALKDQLHQCIQAINTQSSLEQQLHPEATLQEVTEHVCQLLINQQQDRLQLLNAIKTLVEKKMPTSLSSQSTNEEVLVVLQRALAPEDTTSASGIRRTALDARAPAFTPLQSIVVAPNMQADTSPTTVPWQPPSTHAGSSYPPDFALRLAKQFK